MFPIRDLAHRSVLGDSLVALDYFPPTTTTTAVTVSALAPYVKSWTKPANARMCIFILCSGGGGGGAGYAGAQGGSCSGGAGGGNGVLGCVWVPAIFLPDQLYISVGRGGPGAAGGVAGNGATGTTGYPTYVLAKTRDGTSSYQILFGGSGGSGGAGGAAAAISSGGASVTTIGAGTRSLLSVLPNNVPTNNINGANGVNGGAGVAPTSTTILRTPGSSGGGVSAANATFAGGPSGRPLGSFPDMKVAGAASVNDPLAGAMALSTLLQMYGIGVGYGGAGGGGMTSATSVPQGARGGDGDHCGCGGGGGGSTTSPSNTSGRGGNGGDGFCYILSL